MAMCIGIDKQTNNRRSKVSAKKFTTNSRLRNSHQDQLHRISGNVGLITVFKRHQFVHVEKNGKGHRYVTQLDECQRCGEARLPKTRAEKNRRAQRKAAMKIVKAARGALDPVPYISQDNYERNTVIQSAAFDSVRKTEMSHFGLPYGLSAKTIQEFADKGIHVHEEVGRLSSKEDNIKR